jgi:hypothetical protein
LGLRGSPKTGWKRWRTTGALARHVDEIAIRAWQGAPAPPGAQVGVARILGIRWVPYQRATFVTPGFPGFVSGRSTFSRATAEVMAAYTRSVYFPGGLLESRIPAGHRAWALAQRYFNGTARP